MGTTVISTLKLYTLLFHSHVIIIFHRTVYWVSSFVLGFLWKAKIFQNFSTVSIFFKRFWNVRFSDRFNFLLLTVFLLEKVTSYLKVQIIDNAAIFDFSVLPHKSEGFDKSWICNCYRANKDCKIYVGHYLLFLCRPSCWIACAYTHTEIFYQLKRWWWRMTIEVKHLFYLLECIFLT